MIAHLPKHANAEHTIKVAHVTIVDISLDVLQLELLESLARIR